MMMMMMMLLLWDDLLFVIQDVVQQILVQVRLIVGRYID
jgi:hypothetical protein